MIYNFSFLLLIIFYSVHIFAQYTGPVRIAINQTPSSPIQQDIVNSAKIFFQNLLSVNQKSGTNDFQIDFDNSNTSICTDNMPFTLPKNPLPSPSSGTIYFCNLASTDVSNFVYKKMVESVIHGIMKIIAFSSFQPQPSCDNNNVCLLDSTEYSNLKAQFESNYQNSSLQNMQVVKQTKNSIDFYLWNKQYAFEDLMTDNYAVENKYWSKYNNQILKDTKLFSNVNDNMAQQITIPLLGSDNCLIQDELFCTNSQQSLSCNASLTAKSYCKAIDTSQNPCLAYQAVNQGNCLDTQLNIDLKDIITSSGTYEYYGYDSRCFMSDIQDITSQVYILPVRCYKYSCDADNNVYIYLDQSTSQNSNLDVIKCTVSMQGTPYVHNNEKYFSKTGIVCPKNNANFCQGMPKECKNYCSKKGVCVNGKCKCVDGYFGDDCSCFQLSQENGKCVQSCSKKMTQAKDGSQICVSFCNDGEYLNKTDGKCYKCDLNCKTCWEKSDKCDSCDQSNGYTLYKDNTCKQTYPNQKCLQNQFYDGTKCSPCDSSCQSCVINATYCTSCLSNQYLSTDGVCQNCPTNCLTCSGNQLCTQCAANYYLNSLKNECTTSCSSGFYAYQTDCVQTCPSGYFANQTNNTCQQCDTSCLTCSGQSTNCTSCIYYRQLQGSQCIDQCPSNQVYVRKQPSGTSWSFECIACSYQRKCNQCLGSPTYCTDCLPKFYLLNEDCLEACTSSYYADESSRKCIKCDSNCLTCQNSSKNCTSCAQGLYLKSGQCVQSCGSGYVANNDTQNCDVQTQTSDQDTTSSSGSSQSSHRLILSQIVLMISYILLLLS